MSRMWEGTGLQSLHYRALAVDPAAIAGAVHEEQQGEWAGRDETTQIDPFLLEVVGTLEENAEIAVEQVDSSSYGSGYASFIAAFVSARDQSFRDQALAASGYAEGVAGLNVLLCRLAPIACIGGPSRVGTNSGSLTSQGEYLRARHVEWIRLGNAIFDTLTAHGIVVLPPEVLDRIIDPALDIDTNLGDRPFRVFDAWFHWSD